MWKHDALSLMNSSLAENWDIRTVQANFPLCPYITGVVRNIRCQVGFHQTAQRRPIKQGHMFSSGFPSARTQPGTRRCAPDACIQRSPSSTYHVLLILSEAQWGKRVQRAEGTHQTITRARKITPTCPPSVLSSSPGRLLSSPLFWLNDDLNY